MKPWLVATAVFALVSGSLAAAAPKITIPDDPDAIDAEIVVQGERPLERREISRSIHDLTRRDTNVFEIPLCVLAIGLGEPKDKMIAQRIRSNAEAIGLDIAKPGCRPNAIVLVTGEPEKIYAELRRERLGLFGVPRFRSVHKNVLQYELAGGEPAVSWNSSLFVSHDGVTDFNPGGLTVTHLGPSSISTPYLVRQNAVIMFDYFQLDGVHVQQLADYATLHLLGSPQRSVTLADAKVPTLLTLFAQPPQQAAQGLTVFDRAYLCGLYSRRPVRLFGGVGRRARFDCEGWDESVLLQEAFSEEP
ncbi:MAG: hypothetical protein ACXIT4_09825 [Erythrobacter sp.]